MRSPGRFLLFVVLVIVGVKLSEQAYALVAFRDERAQARDLRERLLQTGEELVATRAEFDTLKRRVESQDAELQRELSALRRFTRMGPLTQQVYDRYERERLRYNLHVEERNSIAREWEATAHRHELHAERYDQLADSLQALAVRMGEPYYQVPTALEAAAERRSREGSAP
jgi:aminopeptidase N